MTSDAKSGVAVIAGAIASLITLSAHASGHDLFAGGSVAARQVYLLIAVHALAIAALPVTVFGAYGLTTHLAGEHGFATGALIVCGFGAVAAMGAAAADGLISPGLIAQIVNGPEEAWGTVHTPLAYNALVAQAFSEVFIAGSSIALGLWSAAMLIGRSSSQSLGLLGCAVGMSVLAGLLTGYLRADLRGMRLVAVLESAWLISVGLKMSRGHPVHTTRPRSALVFALLTVPAIAGAQHAVQMAAPAGIFAPKRTNLSTARVEVPMQLVLGGRATVRATVNGQGPFTFAIETGAPMVLVTDKLAAQLHLPTASQSGGMRLQSPAGHAMSLLHIDSLSIGGLALYDVAVSGGPEFIPGIDGLLGLAAYGDLLLTVDYTRETVTFEREALSDPNGRDVFPLVAMGGHVGVEIEGGGRRIPAVIDTQDASYIDAAPEVAANLHFVAAPVVVRQVRIGGLDPVPVSAARLDGDLHLGRYVIQRPIISVLSPPPGYPRQIVLGYQFLRHFAFTLDQHGKRVRFNASGDTIPPSPPIRTIGVVLGAAPTGGVAIADVVAGGAAASAGLRAGDHVVEIAGRRATEFLVPEALASVVQNGGPVRFLIDRSGQRLTIDVMPAARVR